MKCDEHPWYKGTRRPPKRDCKICWEIYYSHHDEKRPVKIVPAESLSKPIPLSKPKPDIVTFNPPTNTETYIYNRFNGPIPCRVEGGEEITLKPGDIKMLKPGEVLDGNTSRLVRRELLVIVIREV